MVFLELLTLIELSKPSQILFWKETKFIRKRHESIEGHVCEDCEVTLTSNWVDREEEPSLRGRNRFTRSTKGYTCIKSTKNYLFSPMDLKTLPTLNRYGRKR